jgi:hypothetical protein
MPTICNKRRDAAELKEEPFIHSRSKGASNQSMEDANMANVASSLDKPKSMPRFSSSFEL